MPLSMVSSFRIQAVSAKFLGLSARPATVGRSCGSPGCADWPPTPPCKAPPGLGTCPRRRFSDAPLGPAVPVGMGATPTRAAICLPGPARRVPAGPRAAPGKAVRPRRERSAAGRPAPATLHCGAASVACLGPSPTSSWASSHRMWAWMRGATGRPARLRRFFSAFQHSHHLVAPGSQGMEFLGVGASGQWAHRRTNRLSETEARTWASRSAIGLG